MLRLGHPTSVARATLCEGGALPVDWATSFRGPSARYRRSSAKNYLELDSAAPMTAWAAASRAVGTRNGEHET